MARQTLLPRLRRAITIAMGGLLTAGAVMRGAPAPSDGEYEAWLREASYSVMGSPPAGTSAAKLARRAGAHVQLPTRSVTEWRPADVTAALRDADSGALARPADLVEAMFSDDRVHGVLGTRVHGLLGLPLQFHGGEDELRLRLEGTKALAGQQAVPGDFWTMFPEAELAQLVSWGILLGVGLAERVPDPDRQVGENNTPTIVVWHPRWLRHDWTSGKWFLMTADGEIEVTPGDGRWILYTPYGSTRPWTLGAWRPLAFAWVLKQFALHDRARHSEVLGSAARVGTVPPGLDDAIKRRWLRDLKNLGRDNAMVLEEGYKLELVEAKGQTWEIYSQQTEWADRAIAIVLAGQFVTTEGTKGFSNGNIHREIHEHLIRFTAETLSTCLHRQALRPWAFENYGDANKAPWARWNTLPPKDQKETAEALAALGDAISKLDAALAPSGVRCDARQLTSDFGVPTVPLPPTTAKPPSVTLAPTTFEKIFSVNEGRASGGVGPLKRTGSLDVDGELMIEEFAEKRKRAGAPAVLPEAA